MAKLHPSDTRYRAPAAPASKPREVGARYGPALDHQPGPIVDPKAERAARRKAGLAAQVEGWDSVPWYLKVLPIGAVLAAFMGEQARQKAEGRTNLQRVLIPVGAVGLYFAVYLLTSGENLLPTTMFGMP